MSETVHSQHERERIRGLQSQSTIRLRDSEGDRFSESEEFTHDVYDVKHDDTQHIAFPFLIVMPDSTFRVLWDTFVTLLLMWTAIVVPLRIAFWTDASDGVIAWEYVIDFFFLVDIGICFISAFVDYEGRVITDRSRIARHYLRTWFLLDLIATIPFSLFYEDGDEVHRMTRLARLPRIIRLSQLSSVLLVLQTGRFSKYFQNVDLHIHSAVKRLFRFFTWMLLIVHVAGCIWYYTAYDKNFNDDTWVVRAQLADAEATQKYLASIYWAFSTITTVGYGDIYAFTEGELIVSILCMIIGVTFYSFTVGNMAAYLTNVDSKAGMVQKLMDEVTNFCHESRLPGELTRRVRAFTRFRTEKENINSYKSDEILAMLSPNLRMEVIMFTHNSLISRIPFFGDKTPEFVAHLVSLLVPLPFTANDFVVRQGETAEEMYFIVSGRAHVVYEPPESTGDGSTGKARTSQTDSKNAIVVRVLVEGSYFGETDILQRTARVFGVRTVTRCQLLALSKENLFSILKNYPDVGLKMRRIAHDRVKRWGDNLVANNPEMVEVMDTVTPLSKVPTSRNTAKKAFSHIPPSVGGFSAVGSSALPSLSSSPLTTESSNRGNLILNNDDEDHLSTTSSSFVAPHKPDVPSSGSVSPTPTISLKRVVSPPRPPVEASRVSLAGPSSRVRMTLNHKRAISVDSETIGTDKGESSDCSSDYTSPVLMGSASRNGSPSPSSPSSHMPLAIANRSQHIIFDEGEGVSDGSSGGGSSTPGSSRRSSSRYVRAEMRKRATVSRSISVKSRSGPLSSSVRAIIEDSKSKKNAKKARKRSTWDGRPKELESSHLDGSAETSFRRHTRSDSVVLDNALAYHNVLSGTFSKGFGLQPKLNNLETMLHRTTESAQRSKKLISSLTRDVELLAELLVQRKDTLGMST